MKTKSKKLEYNFFRILFIFCLSVSILGQTSSINGYLNFQTANSKINEINTSEFIIDIINSFEKYAIYENSSLIGWETPLNSSNYYGTVILRGYQSGIAGIGDFLIDAYLEGYEESLTLLNDIILHFIETYEVDPNGGIYWEKYSNFFSEGWSGNRYGNIGISKFLARAQYVGLSNNLTALVDQAYTWLENLKNEDGSYPISPDSYTTTDQEYGSAGITSSLLSISEYIGNTTYSEAALQIADWLIDQGSIEDGALLIPWTVQGEGTEFNEFRMTGISTGTAGLLMLMLKLFNQTQLPKYYDAAIGLANDLVNRDLGGFWMDNIIGYISKLTANSAFVGYYGGSSGIAIQLLNMYELTNNVYYLESAARVEKWIENFVYANGSVSVGTIYPDRLYTGMTLGSAGVAKYYLDLYNIFGMERHYEKSEIIISHLHELLKTYGVIPTVENNLLHGFSPSIDQGLAGIGKLVLEFGKVPKPIEVISTSSNGYQHIYDTVTVSTEIPTSSDSTSDDSPSFTFYQIGVVIIGIPVLLYIKKTKNNSINSLFYDNFFYNKYKNQ